VLTLIAPQVILPTLISVKITVEMIRANLIVKMICVTYVV